MVYIPKRSVSHILILKKRRENMITTLCYLEKDNKYLMLHRNKKEIDINKGKWLGVGGKLENGETPEECLRREVREETGYELNSFEYRGLVIFNYNADEPLFMYLYTSSDFNGVEKECDEGDLKWISKDEVLELRLWEGDRIFLKLLFENSPFFYLTLDYENDDLIGSKLEFKQEREILGDLLGKIIVTAKMATNGENLKKMISLKNSLRNNVNVRSILFNFFNTQVF